MLLSSAAFFCRSFFYFLQGSYLYFHIICSFPYSHINEDTCIKSEPNTNPYLLLFPFRIRFTLVFVQNPILLSPPCMAGSYLASWPLSLLRALPMLKPNQPFSFPILDSFFILAPNTGTFLYLPWQPVWCKVPVFYVHVSSLEQFSQHSKQCKELFLSTTLTPCLYLWVCEWSRNFNSRIVWDTLSSFLRFIAPEVNRDDSWAALPHVKSHLSVAVRKKTQNQKQKQKKPPK